MEKIIDVHGTCPTCGKNFHYVWDWDDERCAQCVNKEALNDVKWFFLNTLMIGSATALVCYLWVTYIH